MTFSQDDAPRRSQPIRSFNLQQKGLGWLPDVPDQRDYRLDSEEVQFNKRLKRSKDTEWIEDIGDQLIRISKAVNKITEIGEVKKILEANNSDEELLQDLRDFSGTLKAKIFGDITFEKIKLYKVFRKEAPPHPDVIKLKVYLSALGYRGCFKIKHNGAIIKFSEYTGFIDDKGNKQKSYRTDAEYGTHAEWYIEWITSNAFQDDTEEIVKSFQEAVNLPALGIVSMATYTALAKSLQYEGGFNNAGGLKNSFVKQLQEKIDHIQLIPIPITLPHPFLQVLFKELKEIAAKQIKKEIDNFMKDSTPAKPKDLRNNEELFEKITLGNIANIQDDEKNLFLNLFVDFSSLEATDPLEKVLEKLEEILSKNELDTSKDEGYKKFFKIIQSEHFVIEPILTFILKATFPLALHQRDIQVSVLQAVNLLRIINQTLQGDIKNLKDVLGDLRKNLGKDYDNAELEELCQFAIQSMKRFQELFHRAGIESVIEDWRLFQEKFDISSRKPKNEEEKKYFELKKKYFDSICCFYFLLSKLRKALIENPQYFPGTKKVPELIKTEFFRPVGLEKLDTKELYELFSHPDLAIPLSNNFYESANYTSTKESESKIPFFYLPGSVDLSYWCSAIEDQGRLNACSAFAGVALLEYFANRSSGTYMDASPLFLYKAARDLAQASGDIGASLRETMRAMEKFGVPPVQYWPYLPDKVNEEPPQFCYSFAQNYQALKYFRLDYAGISEETLLSQIKAVLAAGFPCAFGLTLYASADDEENVRKGWIPFPTRNDRRVGGHAVVAVGYSDFETVGRKEEGNRPGAFLIRNSWGTNWGRGGYGWLPYDYVLQGLTADWWSLLKATWFEQDSFGLSASDLGGIYPFDSSHR